MSRGQKRWWAGSILIVSVSIGLLFAQTTDRIAPETLLPRGAVLYVGIDGSAENAEAWQQTAAYEALYKSGLMEVASKLFTAIQEHSGGKEGLPGQVGSVLKHVMERGVSLAIALDKEGEGPGAPWGTLVLHDAASFEEFLGNVMKDLVRGEIDFTTSEMNGRSVTRGVIPQTPGVEVGWWSEGSHLVVVAGGEAVRSALAVAEGGPNITASPLWAKYAASDPGFTVGTVGWLDFAALRKAFGGITIPESQHEGRPNRVTVNEVVTLLGLDGLNTVALRSGYKGRACWSEFKIDAPGPRRGVLSLSDQDTFTLDDLPPLPAGSGAFSATSFDWAKAYDTLLDIAHDAEELFPPDFKGQVDGALAQVREVLGLDLRTDLFEPLGNVHTLFADATQTFFGMGFGVVIEVDDAERLRTTIDKLLAKLQQEAGRDVSIRRVDREGVEMVLLQVAGGAFSPALCVGEDWLTLGIVPQIVDAFLMRQTGKLPRWERGPEVRTALGELPEEFTAISVSDPRATYQVLLGFAPFIFGSAQAGLRQSGALPPDFEFPITMADIPPAELVAQPLFPNVTVVGVDENGVTYTTRSSLAGLPLLSGSVDGGTAVASGAVLVALLLPAVQQAREAARRTQSRNNMKQIMLALHNYHDVNNEFPTGTYPNEKLKPEERLSWQSRILPFLEQAALYNQIDFDAGWEDDAHKDLLETRIPIFLNPSNPSTNVEGSNYAPTHYVGLAGLGKEGPTLPVTSRKAGVFAFDRATKIRDITDGTSNTIAIADATDPGPWGAGGAATIRPLTKKPYINGPDGIGGPHAGGINVGLCDGSVRFVSENIDPEVMEALVTIRGGEVIGDF